MVYIDTCYEINDELPKKKTQKENRSAVESAEKWRKMSWLLFKRYAFQFGTIVLDATQK